MDQLEHPRPGVFSLKAKPPEAGMCIPQRVDKRWGWELIFMNEWTNLLRVDEEDEYKMVPNKYCMKILHINEGEETSMHFHKTKHETFIVTKGILIIEFNDGRGMQDRRELKENEGFVVPPGFQHRLIARTEVELIEASTPDSPEDSFRVAL